MATELQFIAIAAFLLWCLGSSVCGVLAPAEEPARLIWREHGPDGWTGWRQAHFGLTAADHRMLMQSEPVLDEEALDALYGTVMLQRRHPDTDAVQFAIICNTPGEERAVALFVSEVCAAVVVK